MPILVTGGSGMVGRALQDVMPNAHYVSSKDCDLRNKEEVFDLFKVGGYTGVIHLASRVGGVKSNTDYIGEFFYENILINTNVLEASRKFEVEKVLSLLSTCIYPDNANYPLTEDQIHNGKPHKSNFGYAHAKRMLDVQSRAYRQQYGSNFITAVPNNLFGKHDNFDLNDSHVIPAIMRKMHEAKLNNTHVELWGDGKPLREFTYAGDLAKILKLVYENSASWR
jgi:GDP-L-fucose synthase